MDGQQRRIVQCLKLRSNYLSQDQEARREKQPKSPSKLTIEETRELGASITAHLLPLKEVPSIPTKRISTKKETTKRS
jgi:hypothetical protein